MTYILIIDRDNNNRFYFGKTKLDIIDVNKEFKRKNGWEVIVLDKKIFNFIISLGPKIYDEIDNYTWYEL